ncbi:unnamed protein product [Malus baccata var. baccata]
MEEVVMSPQDNIWCPSFLSLTGPLTFKDFVMKNDMTAAVVAKNLLTPKDKRLLSKRSDELAVKDSLALSSMSNMAQRLFARTCQVESLTVEVISLKQEIKGLKHENKQLHRLTHSYATSMKRQLDQLQEFEAPNDRPPVPLLSGVLSSTEAPNDQPPVPSFFGVLPSPKTPNDHLLMPPISGVPSYFDTRS